MHLNEMQLTGLPTELDIKNMQAMQMFFKNRAKQFEIDYHNKLRQQSRQSIWFAISNVMLMILFIPLWYYLGRGFLLGSLSLVLMAIITFSIFLIRFNIITHPNKPQNDPGLVVWYFCCLRVGQSGKYSPKKKKADKLRNGSTKTTNKLTRYDTINSMIKRKVTFYSSKTSVANSVGHRQTYYRDSTKIGNQNSSINLAKDMTESLNN